MDIDFPYFDGRTELTADIMNRIVQELRRQSKFQVVAPLDAIAGQSGIAVLVNLDGGASTSTASSEQATPVSSKQFPAIIQAKGGTWQVVCHPHQAGQFRIAFAQYVLESSSDQTFPTLVDIGPVDGMSTVCAYQCGGVVGPFDFTEEAASEIKDQIEALPWVGSGGCTVSVTENTQLGGVDVSVVTISLVNPQKTAAGMTQDINATFGFAGEFFTWPVAKGFGICAATVDGLDTETGFCITQPVLSPGFDSELIRLDPFTDGYAIFFRPVPTTGTFRLAFFKWDGFAFTGGGVTDPISATANGSTIASAINALSWEPGASCEARSIDIDPIDTDRGVGSNVILSERQCYIQFSSLPKFPVMAILTDGLQGHPALITGDSYIQTGTPPPPPPYPYPSTLIDSQALCTTDTDGELFLVFSPVPIKGQFKIVLYDIDGTNLGETDFIEIGTNDDAVSVGEALVAAVPSIENLIVTRYTPVFPKADEKHQAPQYQTVIDTQFPDAYASNPRILESNSPATVYRMNLYGSIPLDMFSDDDDNTDLYQPLIAIVYDEENPLVGSTSDTPVTWRVVNPEHPLNLIRPDEGNYSFTEATVAGNGIFTAKSGGRSGPGDSGSIVLSEANHVEWIAAGTQVWVNEFDVPQSNSGGDPTGETTKTYIFQHDAADKQCCAGDYGLGVFVGFTIQHWCCFASPDDPPQQIPAAQPKVLNVSISNSTGFPNLNGASFQIRAVAPETWLGEVAVTDIADTTGPSPTLPPGAKEQYQFILTCNSGGIGYAFAATSCSRGGFIDTVAFYTSSPPGQITCSPFFVVLTASLDPVQVVITE